jgi:hypothetical protein
MRRAVAIAAVGLSMAGCSGMPELPSLSLGGPAATTVQFESEPSGAEARTSTGQTCRTPCAQAIASNDFTVTFTLNGYQTQTIPVRIASSIEPIDPNTGRVPAPRLVPNPVFAELQPAAPPPPPRRRAAPKPRKPPVAQQQQQQPKPAASSAKPPAAPAAQAPAPAPAAAWPPPPASQSAPPTAAWPAPPPPR